LLRGAIELKWFELIGKNLRYRYMSLFLKQGCKQRGHLCYVHVGL